MLLNFTEPSIKLTKDWKKERIKRKVLKRKYTVQLFQADMKKLIQGYLKIICFQSCLMIGNTVVINTLQSCLTSRESKSDEMRSSKLIKAGTLGFALVGFVVVGCVNF